MPGKIKQVVSKSFVKKVCSRFMPLQIKLQAMICSIQMNAYAVILH